MTTYPYRIKNFAHQISDSTPIILKHHEATVNKCKKQINFFLQSVSEKVPVIDTADESEQRSRLRSTKSIDADRVGCGTIEMCSKNQATHSEIQVGAGHSQTLKTLVEDGRLLSPVTQQSPAFSR